MNAFEKFKDKDWRLLEKKRYTKKGVSIKTYKQESEVARWVKKTKM